MSDRVLEGCSSITIAHRLTTIRNADLVPVMRDGRIIERGTHDSLLGTGGYYSVLYRDMA